MSAINAKFRTVAMFVTYLTDDITGIIILIQNIDPVGHYLSPSYKGLGGGGGSMALVRVLHSTKDLR
jgi:hypothetical protein